MLACSGAQLSPGTTSIQGLQATDLTGLFPPSVPPMSPRSTSTTELPQLPCPTKAP